MSADNEDDDEMPDFSDVQSGASSTAPAAEVYETYEIKSGDSLSKIAQTKNIVGGWQVGQWDRLELGGKTDEMLAELVAETLRRRIVTGDYDADELLPPEGTLMSTFNVARTTIRDAFRMLESEGLIVVRRGAGGGARVRPPAAVISTLVKEQQ